MLGPHETLHKLHVDQSKDKLEKLHVDQSNNEFEFEKQ